MVDKLKQALDAVAARGVVLNEVEVFPTPADSVNRRNPEIPDDTLRKVCRIGQGARCCRYILGGADGITCAKHDPAMASMLDERVASGTFIAKGDNCPGLRVQ